jgi:hypothetical protein
MSQTRKGSLSETVLNILIGYIIAILTQLTIFPLYEINITLYDNLWIGVWFSVASFIRGYLLRRWFNGLPTFKKVSRE